MMVVAAIAVALVATRGATTRNMGGDMGRRRRSRNEGRRWHIISIDHTVLDVDLLKKDHGVSGLKGREGVVHLQIRHHVAEFAIEAIKESEHEHAVTELSQGDHRHLEAVIEVVDGLPSLFGGAKLSEKKKGM
jgi:hypothetical protein